jgi:hypothetical protein
MQKLSSTRLIAPLTSLLQHSYPFNFELQIDPLHSFTALGKLASFSVTGLLQNKWRTRRMCIERATVGELSTRPLGANPEPPPTTPG